MVFSDLMRAYKTAMNSLIISASKLKFAPDSIILPKNMSQFAPWVWAVGVLSFLVPLHLIFIGQFCRVINISYLVNRRQHEVNLQNAFLVLCLRVMDVNRRLSGGKHSVTVNLCSEGPDRKRNPP